jgi:UDP-N-acetylglucosamine:LPS N-acetylglucosamine transferase
LNAEPFERAGAAVVIANQDCDGPGLVRVVSGIVNDADRYSKMVDAMRSLGRPRAADAVVDLLRDVLKH